ncbi:MAG: biopolymer transporter ExbD [Acidobacteriota bacterium]
MQFRERPGPQVSIDLSPLIDVVFLLLIFFAATTTFLQGSSLELELPESTSAEESQVGGGAGVITIGLAADGMIQFQAEVTTLERLEEQLRQALRANSDAAVVLRADREARHGQVVAVLDAVRRSGARGLSIATTHVEREPERQPAQEGSSGSC